MSEDAKEAIFIAAVIVLMALATALFIWKGGKP